MIIRNIHILYMLCVLVSSPIVAAQELRLGIAYDNHLTNRLTYNAQMQVRHLSGPVRTIYGVSQLGVEYSVSPKLRFGSSLRYAIFPSIEDEFDNFDDDERLRVTLDASLRSKKYDSDFRLMYRLRFQYSNEWGRNLNFNLRNRLKLKYYKVEEMKPYLAFEVYHHLMPLYFSRGRVFIGTDIEIFKVSMEVFFITEVNFQREKDFSSQMLGLIFTI